MDKSFLIREISPDTDHVISVLASVRRVPKWMIIREALDEYAQKHRKEIAQAARKDNGR